MLSTFQLQISEQIPPEINNIILPTEEEIGVLDDGFLADKSNSVTESQLARISVSGKHSFPLHISIEAGWEERYASRLINDTGSTAKGF